MTPDEYRDGFRYMPPEFSLHDVKGRFTQNAVGLRTLPDGSFVQDVEVEFHELLLGLALLVCSYEGLNYGEKAQKHDELLCERALRSQSPDSHLTL